MKCELCHQKEAASAIQVQKNGVTEELYVCRACAEKEQLRHQKKSQRTHKAFDLPPGVSISVSGMGDADSTPPILEAIMQAFDGLMAGANTPNRRAKSSASSNAAKKVEYSCEQVNARYRIGSRLHLEGLNLIGELDAVRRAAEALDLELEGVTADGVHLCGHVFVLKHSGLSERASRTIADLIAQERNARFRLFDEMPRVWGDATNRALAILKNCRLLSPGELFDLLSPLRLAAYENLLENITLDEICGLMESLKLDSYEDQLSQGKRDRLDAKRADEMNKRFEKVFLKA